MNFILIRGLARESRHCQELTELLSKEINKENIHRFELPGNGEFYQQTSPINFRAYTKHVAKQASKIEPPYCVIGISLGGMIAVGWAQQDTNNAIEKLVLINTSSNFSPFYKRASRTSYMIAARILCQSSIGKQEKNILSLVSNLHANDPKVLANWIDIQLKHPVTKTNFVRQLIAAARMTHEQSAPNCDDLLLLSQQDRMVHPDCTKDIKQMWDWPLKIHPTAGHDLILDDPGWIIEKLIEVSFLPNRKNHNHQIPFQTQDAA